MGEDLATGKLCPHPELTYVLIDILVPRRDIALLICKSSGSPKIYNFEISKRFSIFGEVRLSELLFRNLKAVNFGTVRAYQEMFYAVTKGWSDTFDR